jgi:hypothetical protein
MTEPTSSSALQAGGDETPVAPERFLMDHGMWHDLMTGQHLYTEDQHRAELDGVTNDAWAALEAAGVKRDGWLSLPEAIGKLATRPTPAAAAGAPINIEEAVSRLEDDIAAGKMGVSTVFTRMRYLLKLAASPIAPAGVPSDERQAFEAWANEGETEGAAEYLTRRFEEGDYRHSVMQRMWNAWQARAVLSAGAPAVPLQPDSSSVHSIADGGQAPSAGLTSQPVGGNTAAPTEVDALLPCPFCGGEASADGVARYADTHEAWFADGTRITEAFFCNCMVCGATSRGMCGHQTREKAIAVWNRRAIQCDGRDGVTGSAASSEAREATSASNGSDGHGKDCA